MQAPAPPPFDFERFQWKPSPSDSKTYQREAFGTEALADYENRYQNGAAALFLGVTLDFAHDVPLVDFLRLAREAWIILRFGVPTIAASMTVNDQDQATLNYSVPETFGDVRNWAERTVIPATHQADLEELRYEVGQRSNPARMVDMTDLYVVAPDERPAGFLLHTSRALFDRTATYILMRGYLRTLAFMIAGNLVPDLSTLVWGQEVQNLLPSTSQVMSADEPREGPAYLSTLHEMLTGFTEHVPRTYSFKIRSYISAGPTRHMQRCFSREESEEFYRAADEEGFDVAELFHAALCLVIAKDNPPTSRTPEDAAFIFPHLTDGRSRLGHPFSGRDGYPGCAGAASTVAVPAMDMIRGKTGSFDKELLLAIADLIQEEYERVEATPALLAVQGQLFDKLLPNIKAGLRKFASPMAPSFVGEGRLEDHIDRSYNNRAGRAVFSIRSIFSSVNRNDPGPLFRVSEWRDAIQLDIDYNAFAMPPEAVEQFMDDWIGFARLVFS